jgi:hypothetical protein
MTTIGSAHVWRLSSPALIEMRDSVAEARKARLQADRYISNLEYDISMKISSLTRTRNSIMACQADLTKIENSWLRRFRKRSITRAHRELADATQKETDLMADEQSLRDQLAEAQERRDSLWVKSVFELSGPVNAAWKKVVEKFVHLSMSVKIWDITADRSKRSGEERSIANRVLDRTETTLSVSELPFFDPGFPGLHWHNANGDDLFFYPGLVAVVRKDDEFALISTVDIDSQFNLLHFDERESVPSDSRVVGETWQYANAKGGPDRRYRNNQCFPIALYAELRFRSKTGLDESFLFSNAEASAGFADAWAELEKLIRLPDQIE